MRDWGKRAAFYLSKLFLYVLADGPSANDPRSDDLAALRLGRV